MTDRDKTISPPGSALRRRMIEDMTVRKLAPKTQATYTNHGAMAPAPRHEPRPTERDHHRGREVPSMPAPDPGHGAARLEAIPSPQLTRQDPPAPPQSRRDTMPAGLAAAQTLAVQQTTQRPQATLPASNPHSSCKPSGRV